MPSSCYAEGGEVDGDHEMLMDQCAQECMDAIESKDKSAFKEALHTLIADLLMKMESSEGEEHGS